MQAVEGILKAGQQPGPATAASGPSLAFLATPPTTSYPWASASQAHRPGIHAFIWLVAHFFLRAKSSPFQVDLLQEAILARTGQLGL